MGLTVERLEHRLPEPIETLLVDLCEPQHRRHLRIHLDLGSTSMVECFMEALASDMEVHEDVCDDDPREICVRATGIDRSGSHWRDLSIILLAPEWANDAESSRHAAGVIVENWPSLVALAARVPIRNG